MIELVCIVTGVVLMGVVLFAVYVRCSTATCEADADMTGRVVVVTGANAGIGFHTARSLAARGARVILACRSPERGGAARDAIVAATGNWDVVFKTLDLSSLKSVRQFADDVLASEPRLHVLINNAGLYGRDELTDDRIVESMQVNYFGHFLLTLLLLPLLKKSRPSRIVNLSSIMHFAGTFNPGAVDRPVRFLGAFRNYCDSKFCMLMFTMELSRRLRGSGVVANAVHPGVVMTGIMASHTSLGHYLFCLCTLLCGRSPAQGAQTVEYAATAAQCADLSGHYLVDCASRVVHWKARSEPAADKLWRYSEKIVGYKDF